MTSSSSTSALEKVAFKWVPELYGISAKFSNLTGYDDINFLLRSGVDGKYVLKISDNNGSVETLHAQNRLLQFLQKHSQQSDAFPAVIAGKDGSDLYQVSHRDQNFWLRILTYLEGDLLHQVTASSKLYEHLGGFLGALNQCLLPFDLPELHIRKSPWDLQYAGLCMEYCTEIEDPHYRRLVWYFMQQYEYQVVPNYPKLPRGLIHGDANDHNILVSGNQVTGLIDFGDTTYSHLINELAVAITYVMMGDKDPLKAASWVVKGYHRERPLTSLEIEVLYYLVAARLCTSLCISTHSQNEDPTNEYLGLHQTPVKRLLDWLISINPVDFEQQLKKTCSIEASEGHSIDELKTVRSRYFSKAMSLNYQDPLIMVRGALQYLYDSQGKAYLDGVNNISHVGHCHPGVVSAAITQLTQLNTNTRYLYPQLNEYACLLCEHLPEPLSVVFFVNSGTEANELALRMAGIHTGYNDILVIEDAYHGNSLATLEVSPYKYRGKGGFGKKPHIHELLSPDLYRGRFRAEDPSALSNYLDQMQKTIEQVVDTGGGLAGFIGESLLGCGGQVVLPKGYLEGTYGQIRKYGGVCIADEVQVGFGRIGSHFWGFQSQGVVPDIVTMGKPMGNGHPLAAIVTTAEIANSFNNGMEYFNSFGGNPVSCEIGKAVLQIIQEEKLQQNAELVGATLKSGLNKLKDKHEMVGDVRGLGLFLGIELVEDRETKDPAATLATRLVESMKERGVLLGIDGPRHNVVKIKPPLVFSNSNAEFLVDQLGTVLHDLENS
jgi:4-aminobutyrate aminotransferase-like enzyme/Ser/Thr protein kinase RdoA (MazF antagonist)